MTTSIQCTVLDEGSGVAGRKASIWQYTLKTMTAESTFVLARPGACIRAPVDTLFRYVHLAGRTQRTGESGIALFIKFHFAAPLLRGSACRD
jgi:hypothetical protein